MALSGADATITLTGGWTRRITKGFNVTTQLSGPERLAGLDLSLPLVSRVLRRADAEAARCSALDPPILEGLLRWGRCTRFLREELIPAGWSYDNPRNLARTIHPAGEFAVVIATGDDQTGLANGRAGPRHPKGYATEQAVNANGQLSFDFGSLLHVSTSGLAAAIGSLRTWLMLFCVDEDVFRVELSLPEAIEAGRITRWTERILLPPVPRDQSVTAPVGPADRVTSQRFPLDSRRGRAARPTGATTHQPDTPDARSLIAESASGSPEPCRANQ